MQDSDSSSSNQQGMYEEVLPTQTPGDRNTLSSSSLEQRTATNNTAAYLDSLSKFAGRSFASTQESVEAILRLIVEQLGLRSSFFTHISRKDCQNEVRAAYNSTGGSGVQEGDLLELAKTF